MIKLVNFLKTCVNINVVIDEDFNEIARGIAGVIYCTMHKKLKSYKLLKIIYYSGVMHIEVTK